MMGRLALVPAVCLLSLWKTGLAGHRHPEVDLTDGLGLANKPPPDHNSSTQRGCTLDELLPLTYSGSERSSEWSKDDIVEYPYNCSCPAMKSRYVCPTEVRSAYPKWVPSPEASGACTSATREELDMAPFPPNFKVLIYGNSHMRQTVESIMCVFQRTMTSKRVSVGPLAVASMVESDSQCRACFDVNRPNVVSSLNTMLLDNECIDEHDDAFTCRCDDDHGEFFFENGATVHYTMSDRNIDKNLTSAQRHHGNNTISSYDVIIMNAGNPPGMTSTAALTSAIEVQSAGVQFFWFSMYDPETGVDSWPESERETFFESGAKFLDVHRMVGGMRSWSRGQVVPGSKDPHFCMPGPTNEIAILVLKLMRAVHDAAK